MSSKIKSVSVIGLNCELVEVEADKSSHGHPGISIVGLPDKAVGESSSRVISAIKNSGLEFPRGNVVVNLAPADLKKSGTYYDLPIALTCLEQGGYIDMEKFRLNSIFIGELALDGSLRPVNGVLSVALMCKKRKIANLFVPKDNGKEASLVSGVNVFAVENLRQLANHLRQINVMNPLPLKKFSLSQIQENEIDMNYIKGQEAAKRALEIAAAGSHNILFFGPPGSGKTMLAKAAAGILPNMSLGEALEVTKIYSVAGELSANESIMTTRPFRAPHHTASGVALVGGGAWPRPGEISLAHRGVLFLDEFLEFPKSVLENLRQPLEDGIVSVSRAAGTLRFPARFMLIAAMNPCPCGYYTDEDKECVCSLSQIIKYQKRASGPLMDRIDLHIEVPRIKYDKLRSENGEGDTTANIKKRVQNAREIQLNRFKKDNIIANSEMSSQDIKRYCQIDSAGEKLLKQAVDALNLSARSYHRVLKLSRTIADLVDSDNILPAHLAEALQYRQRNE